MTDSLLATGIYLLATSSTRYPNIWFMGHSGSAILAGRYLLEEHKLSTETSSLIQAQISYSLAKEKLPPNAVSTWLQETRVQSACEAADNIQKLVSEIRLSCEQLSATGHGVIYASFALKAFSEAPQLASVRNVNGVIELIDLCRQDKPSRYFGCNDYSNFDCNLGDYEALNDIEAVISKNLFEHNEIFDDREYDGVHYYFGGNTLHSLTYADALLSLSKLGYSELCSIGLLPLKKHIVMSQLRPIDLESLPHRSFVSPATAEYWRKKKIDPHHLKAGYSLLNLLELLPEEARADLETTMAAY